MNGLRLTFNRKAAVGLSLIIAVLMFISAAVFVASRTASATSSPEPFKITEHTEYGFSSNDVYLTFTDSLGMDQSLTNVTFAFADSSKTRTLDVKELLAYQSYQTDVYGIANVSKGKVAKSEQKTISDNVNGTKTPKIVNVYYDSLDRMMDCDFVEGGDCLKAETAVVGKETKHDYLSAAAYVREKEITDGTRITQKADVGMQIPKGGETRVKVSMSHLPFYKMSVGDWENKYNITACSDAGCVDLDPTWWNVSYDYRYIIKSNSTVTNSSIIAVNDTYGINGNVMWANNASAGEKIYLYCQNSGCKSGLIAVANETHEKSWLNETNGGGNAPNAVSPKGLVGWWTFNNATGTDVSGKGHVLTASGSPPTVAGLFGNGTQTGSSDAWWMTSADASSWIEGAAQITVCAWAYPTSSAAGKILVTKVNDFYVSGYGSGGNIKVMLATAGGEVTVEGNPVSLNVWSLQCMVYNSTHLLIFQNGTLTGTVAKTGTIYPYNGGGYNFGIGQTPPPYNSERFIGTMDDVRIYNVSLSAKDIQDIYYNGKNNHTSLGTAEEFTAECDEASARSWIEAGIRDALGSPTIYTDKQVYTRNLTNGQQLGKFDKFVANGTKRWAFNFVSTGESATNMRNMTPVFYVWELVSSSCAGTEASVHNFIDQTK